MPDWMWKIFGQPCVTARCGEMLCRESRLRPKNDDDEFFAKVLKLAVTYASMDSSCPRFLPLNMYRSYISFISPTANSSNLSMILECYAFCLVSKLHSIVNLKGIRANAVQIDIMPHCTSLIELQD